MTTRPQFEDGQMRITRLVCASLAVAIAGACSIDADPDATPVGGGGSAAGALGTSGQATSGAANTAGSSVQSGGTPASTGGTVGTAGQTNTGGQSAGSGTGGASGGASGGQAGGRAGTGGSQAGASQGGAGGGLMPGNPPVLSAGCGKAAGVTNGKKTIKSTNVDRTYIIDIPTNYDMNKPYKLFYTSHWISSTSEAVQQQNYYFLKPLATAASEPAIFVAPQSDDGTWDKPDHALFDDILAYVKTNLCIDTTRVFATGFSFGGMITYSLSLNHQTDIRAAVGIAPANFNIYIPPKTHAPIAWMSTTGMGDGTCPWVQNGSMTNGAKFAAIEHATDNGCTIPADVPTWKSGDHVCYDFVGCKAGYPTKACTFDGGHTNIDDEGGKNWIAEESWKFFKQF